MQTITFECEVITPMFLAGADGITPELRPASIKGALRFWWRAMNGHLSLDDMKRAEGEIFGSTSQKSMVVLRTNMIERQEGQLQKLDALSGRDYLMYSVFPPMNTKVAFLTGKFQVHLSSSNISLLKNSAYCFWLMSNFGGLGTRSRRGSGKFLITNYRGIDFAFSFNSNSIDLTQHIEYLRNGIQTIKTHFNVISSNNTTDFPCFKNCNIYVLSSGKPKSENALNDIGNFYMNFRRRRTPDYQYVKDYIQSGIQPNTIEKSVLGLPFGYRYRSLKGKSATIEAKSKSRSASSLFIEVIKVGSLFYPLIINFNSKLLDVNDKLKISSKEQRGKTKYPPQSLIDLKTTFINGLTNKILII